MELKKDRIRILHKLDTMPEGYYSRTVARYYIVSIDGLECEYIETKTYKGSKIRIQRNKELLYQTCCKCKVLLSVDAFSKGANYCKSCIKIDYKKAKKKGATQSARWRKANPIHAKVLASNGRGRRRGKGEVSLEQVLEVVGRFTESEKIECVYCERKMSLTNSEFHLDHFNPLSSHGLNSVDNIVPTCKYCNHAKKDEDFFEWSKDYFSHNSILTPYQVQKRMVDYFKEYYDIDYSDRINVPAD